MQQIDQNGGINLKGVLCLLVMFASCLTAHLFQQTGAAIGDGCIGNSVGTCGGGLQSDQIDVNFYQGHGMFPQVRVCVCMVGSVVWLIIVGFVVDFVQRDSCRVR